MSGSARRRALKANAKIVEKVDYNEIYERDYRCYLCKKDFKPEDLTNIDHKMPISRGGNHEMNNLAAVHQSCNDRKGSMTPEEFFKESVERNQT